jgi:cytosine/adenosine deaminase-related metal-dependent hydrolase
MDFVSGEILTVDGFEKGYVGFEKSIIVEMEKGACPKKSIAKGLIVPSFINAHTHIGDSFIKEKKIELPKDVNKLVAPPDGLKHRMLREASDDDIIDGMEKSLDIMIKTGTSCFCDFRENSILGICQLKTALHLWNISSIILSRPDELIYDKDELDLLLKNSDGIGLSSISDWDFSELEKISKHVRKKNKIFALHVSERIRENIDSIVALKPNLLVHMIKATESDLIRVKDNNIPIVICARSNAFYGLKPNIKLMKKVGVEMLIGTDNVMLNSPSILDEIMFLKNHFKEYSISDLLYIVTYGARKALNLDCNILGPNSKADFVVLDKKSLKPLYIASDK